ncbi:ribonuclease J [Patescibacteria group bacterium]|nr:ribonuclease J [Patescibacteria group bacterium]
MEKLRIIPIGGLEEVGKNCTVFEQIKENNVPGDIVVVDMGLDFPGPDMPGVDYILPDISYLRKNKKRIKGLVITHGHLDHIGAIHHLIKEIGNPKIYASKLAIGFIRFYLKEFKIDNVNLVEILDDQSFSLGSFEITPFHVVHNIPDSFALIIKTKFISIFHTGDFKLDKNPADQTPMNMKRLKQISRQGVDLYMADSTNANIDGTTTPEKEVGRVIDSIVQQSKSRIIFTTFSTLISRISQVIESCKKYNRKIVVVGFSIKKSIVIAERLGFLKIPNGLIKEVKDIKSIPDKNLLILATGAQGEERSAMSNIARGEHRLVRIKKGDTVVFSSSTIPGNELSVHRVINGLVSQGAEIIYRRMLGLGVHSSGHAFGKDLSKMLKIIRPNFFIPVHGEPYMRSTHIKLAKQNNIRESNCFMLKNGSIFEIDEIKNARILSKEISLTSPVVEGKNIKIISPEIIKQRKIMAEAGICIVSISYGKKKNSRNVKVNFLGLSADKQIIMETKQKANALTKKHGTDKKSKEKIALSLSDFILNKTGKKPLVIIV